MAATFGWFRVASRRASRSKRRRLRRVLAEGVGHDLDRHLAAEGGIEGAVDAAHPPLPRSPRTTKRPEGGAGGRGSGPSASISRASSSKTRPRRASPGWSAAAPGPRRASAARRAAPGARRPSARFVEKARALGGGAVEGGVQQLVEPRPVVSLKHASGLSRVGSSSARSQARARIHPRCAVRSESPRARAVSASSRPPKKRHSKMRGELEVALAQALERAVDVEEPLRRRAVRGQPVLVELLGGLARAALVAQPRARAGRRAPAA